MPPSNQWQRAKLFVESIRSSRKCPVASLFGMRETDEIVTMPFLKEKTIEQMEKKQVICDFMQWYYDQYESSTENTFRRELDRAVKMATQAIEASLSREDAIRPPITNMIIAPDSDTQSEYDSVIEYQSNVPKQKPAKNPVSVTSSRKSKKTRKHARVSIDTSQMSITSSPSRTWGAKKISEQRIKQRRGRPKKRQKTSKPASTSCLVTPHHQRTKTVDPGIPVAPSTGKESVTSRDSEGTIMEKLPWKHMWDSLKRRGWSCVKAPNPLHDWYYCRPGRTIKNGTLGTDYFKDTSEVMNFVIEEEKKTAEEHTSSITWEFEEEKNAESTESKKGPAHEFSPDSSSSSKYEINFSKAYKLLLRLHFRYVGGKYVWPGVNMKDKKNITLNWDYFERVEDMRSFLCSKKRDIPGIDGDTLTRIEKKQLYHWINAVK